MPYSDGVIRETHRGFGYDPDYLNELGVVEQNGVRLIYNRQDGYLEVERTEPTLETIKQDIERLQGYE